MKQKQLRTVPELIAAGSKASGGAAEHGAAIGLVFGSKANIDADLAGLIVARDNGDVARSDLSTKRRLLRTVTQSAISFATALRIR